MEQISKLPDQEMLVDKIEKLEHEINQLDQLVEKAVSQRQAVQNGVQQVVKECLKLNQQMEQLE